MTQKQARTNCKQSKQYKTKIQYNTNHTHQTKQHNTKVADPQERKQPASQAESSQNWGDGYGYG